MSFKVIAIRPLSGINKRFLKNLSPGETYNLCNDYTLLNENRQPVGLKEQVYSIRYKKTVPDSLYSIRKNDTQTLNVNISAIVGKNGAGKSSLMDLILLSLFVVSRNLGFVKPENFIEESSEVSFHEEVSRLQAEIRLIKEGLKVELYYLLNEKYYRLIVKNGTFLLQSYDFNDINGFRKDRITIREYEEVNNFFYTVVVNYSFYAYNSNYNGIWLKSFFHKNDGYQMPIVINPFRNKGNIDINSETLLTRARLLSNILSITKYKKINYKSTIDRVELYFNKNKDYKFLSDGEMRFSQKFRMRFRELVLFPLYSRMFEGQSQYPPIDTPIKEYAETYLINKLITIPSRYESFKEFDKRIAKRKERADNFNLTQGIASKYVDELFEDRSHITLKVRQTLNFLREDIYNLPSTIDLKSKFDIRSVVTKMNSLKKTHWFTELVDYLPPPFLFNRIRFKDGSYFDDLSSGEKQKIYSLNSVIYHLKNIDSINNNKRRNTEKKISSYESVNLVFDEVELYYHPQFQKETISALLNLLRIANFRFLKNINIIFLTHSPFILSDIPIQNTTLLSIDKTTGKSKLVKRKKQSFGANIHDLLADNFFLTGALIGDFADGKIMSIITKLKKSSLSKDEELALELLGDKFLKSSIKEYQLSHDQDPSN